MCSDHLSFSMQSPFFKYGIYLLYISFSFLFCKALVLTCYALKKKNNKINKRPVLAFIAALLKFECSIGLPLLWTSFQVSKLYSQGGLPWWRSGGESACQCRGHGFEPWSGSIPHASEQLGPRATTTEPLHLEPVLCSRRSYHNERPAHHNEE